MKTFAQIRIKLFTASAVIVLAVVAAFVTVPKASMTNMMPVGPGAERIDAAGDYAAQCANCHGSDGRSQTAKGRKTHAADLTKSTVSDAKGIRIITNGRDEMPGFGKTMSAERIAAVMEYTHRFR